MIRASYVLPARGQGVRPPERFKPVRGVSSNRSNDGLHITESPGDWLGILRVGSVNDPDKWRTPSPMGVAGGSRGTIGSTPGQIRAAVLNRDLVRVLAEEPDYSTTVSSGSTREGVRAFGGGHRDPGGGEDSLSWSIRQHSAAPEPPRLNRRDVHLGPPPGFNSGRYNRGGGGWSSTSIAPGPTIRASTSRGWGRIGVATSTYASASTLAGWSPESTTTPQAGDHLIHNKTSIKKRGDSA